MSKRKRTSRAAKSSDVPGEPQQGTAPKTLSGVQAYIIKAARDPHGRRNWTNQRYELERVKSKYRVERAQAAIVAIYNPRSIPDMINQSDLHRKVNELWKKRDEKPVSRGTVVEAWEKLREANSR